ncbi:cache domain-containing sensor histidine kinase [Cohnella silvisoli]|uniref:Sensor histidine kinase n=1 Tax=Cohnella silvisoli TaxID=2873699 RepID=A0ABV1KTF0_9BACL|nr:sensor histidine kinase [Cohnella silvisoli]MCD9021295.1 sensor histidine kinase [Cohnella silvisoli]
MPKPHRGLFQNISIKNKILILCISTVLIPLLILSYFAAQISSKAIIEKARHSSLREIALVERNLASITTNAEDYIRILVLDYRLQETMDKIAKMDRSLLQELEEKVVLSEVLGNVTFPATRMSAASIVLNDGSFIELGAVDASSLKPVFDKAYIREIIDRQKPVWSSLFPISYRYGMQTSENGFAISKSIVHKYSGETLGVALLFLSEKELSSVYKEQSAELDKRFYLVDDRGMIISSGNKDHLYRPFDELTEGQRNFLTQDGTRVGTLFDQKMLITVKTFDKLNWKIVNIVPLHEITVEKDNIVKLIAFVGCLCLLAAVTAAYMLSNRISKPILRLAQAMKSVIRGNMDVRTKLTSSDEIGILSGGFDRMMDQMKKLMSDIYLEQQAKRESEFKLMQSQIKPHFLYNTLETIVSLSKLGLMNDAITATKNLAGFYRISLSNGNDRIRVEEEVQLTRDYLSILFYRYVEFMDYRIEVEESILGYAVPKLTLQPIVENAVYHGLKKRMTKGMLVVKGYAEKETIVFEIEDDGVGMDETTIREMLKAREEGHGSQSFGVGSVHSRIRLLYGEEYGLTIESRIGQYTRVTIRLPKQKLHERGEPDAESSDRG